MVTINWFVLCVSHHCFNTLVPALCQPSCSLQLRNLLHSKGSLRAYTLLAHWNRHKLGDLQNHAVSWKLAWVEADTHYLLKIESLQSALTASDPVLQRNKNTVSCDTWKFKKSQCHFANLFSYFTIFWTRNHVKKILSSTHAFDSDARYSVILSI